MKTYITFITLLVIVSLVGCNSLVTKLDSGAELSVLQPEVDNLASESLEKDSNVDGVIDRIEAGYDDLGALAFSFDYSTSSPSAVFSHSWEAVDQKQSRKLSSIKSGDSSLNVGSSVVSRRYPGRPKSVVNNKNKRYPHKSVVVGTAGDKNRRYPYKSAVAYGREKGSYSYQRQMRDAVQMVGQEVANALSIIPSVKPGQYNSNPSGRKDLWSRIVKGYGLPNIDNERIQYFVKNFANNPYFVEKISVKARPYLYYIVEEVEKRNMPLEIALLPAIESAFEPMALSHKSAAGLWQFIPATGREYGLEQNQWYDGRRDIILSTRAALTYLQRLVGMFDGDWFLALAAYNYGQGNVRRSIERNLLAGKPADFWSLNLPRETRQYVPKLLALCRVIANPQIYDLQIASIVDRPYFIQVGVGHPIDLNLAAQLAGLSLQEFKQLNAAYRAGATGPNGPHLITLPAFKVKSFKQRMAKIPLSQRMYVYAENKPVIRFVESGNMDKQDSEQLAIVSKIQQYRVDVGDNLWTIAKRYDTSVSMIRQLNQLDEEAAIYPGHLLVVPAQNSSQAQLTILQSHHRVTEGESLVAIAKRYDVSITQLRQLNKIQGGEALRQGTVLKIPVSDSSP
jgi:membrane-bound lytic murein transglycosylase D